MKDLKRKIHYWCSDTMRNKITGKGVVCAVLDTGITQHPDLIGRIVGWKDCVQGKKTIYDDNGHGTHVAGILAGNGKSGRGLYSGMAPEAQIFAVKVLNQRGGGKIRDVINGIRYVLLKQKEMKIRIVNISIGTLPHKKDPEDELFLFWVERLWDAGLVVVTAAGNKGPKEGSVTIPGNSRKVITVGADEELGKKYSGCGPTGDCIKKPDLAVPGNRIYSCNYLYPVRSPYAYIPKTGTSMATPVVSGAAALVLQKYPDMCNLELKYRLWNSCEKGRYYDQRQGHGNLHVEKFLECQEKILDTNENLLYEQTLLYDFYGELLTKHQKEIYEQAVLEDYSLSEIARDAGISRQGVHDMIRRCNKSLEDYEAKLHLVEKFMSVKKKVHEIDLLLENYEEQDEKELIKKVKKLSGEIIEEL